MASASWAARRSSAACPAGASSHDRGVPVLVRVQGLCGHGGLLGEGVWLGEAGRVVRTGDRAAGERSGVRVTDRVSAVPGRRAADGRRGG